MTPEHGKSSYTFLKHGWENLTERERRIIQHALNRAAAKRDNQRRLDDERTFGERLADRLAQSGGSWTFIIVFIAVLLAWIITNGIFLARIDGAFDPFPFILLNLILSMLAALQAPVILMSQNRYAAKDRLQSTHDYEVDLKAELEIVNLHEKLDELRTQKWAELVAMQQEQIKILQQLLQASPVHKP